MLRIQKLTTGKVYQTLPRAIANKHSEWQLNLLQAG